MPDITPKSKAAIDALTEQELRFEIERGRTSRFQREKFAYLKTRLHEIENNRNQNPAYTTMQDHETIQPKPPPLLQHVKWFWLHGKQNIKWIVLALFVVIIITTWKGKYFYSLIYTDTTCSNPNILDRPLSCENTEINQ